MKVRWTATAKQSYYNILDYLEESWPIREVNSFIELLVFWNNRQNPEKMIY